MEFKIGQGFVDTVARAPEVEKFVGNHLVSVVAELGLLTGEKLYRYYVDGKSGVAYSTVDLALTQGVKSAKKLEAK